MLPYTSITTAAPHDSSDPQCPPPPPLHYHTHLHLHPLQKGIANAELAYGAVDSWSECFTEELTARKNEAHEVRQTHPPTHPPTLSPFATPPLLML